MGSHTIQISRNRQYTICSNKITSPNRNMFTFTDSSWDDDIDTSRSTGGYLILYQGGVIDHSSNMPIPVALSSAEAEYNQCCLACMATGNMHMTLNHVEGIKEGSDEDLPIDIFMDNKSKDPDSDRSSRYLLCRICVNCTRNISLENSQEESSQNYRRIIFA